MVTKLKKLQSQLTASRLQAAGGEYIQRNFCKKSFAFIRVDSWLKRSGVSGSMKCDRNSFSLQQKNA
jgi:hypothetical protein